MADADTDSDLIDRIYEASFAPKLWPPVLDSLAAVAGARGGVLFAATTRVLNWTASDVLIDTFQSYVEDGWLRRCTRRTCLLTELRPTFLVEHDIWTETELDGNPVYRDFLRPRGLGWSAGIAVPMPTGDTVVLTVEREYASGPVHRDEVGQTQCPAAASGPRRPARRTSEAGSQRRRQRHPRRHRPAGDDAHRRRRGRRRQRAGRSPRRDSGVAQWHDRVALVDPAADALLWAAVQGLSAAGGKPIQSFPVRDSALQPSMVAHVVPVRGTARDLFPAGTAMLVLTPLKRPDAPALDPACARCST